jgi:type I restriction enzyme S subunit
MREVATPSATGNEEMLSVSHLTGVTPRSEKTVYMFEAESTVGYKMVAKGDLVINTMWAWMGAAGTAPVGGIVSPAYGVYRIDTSVVDPRWVDYVIRTPWYVTEMTRHSRGVTSSRLRLYPDEFLRLSMPLPPLAEQREIADYLDAETTRIDALVAKNRQLVRLLEERWRVAAETTMNELGAEHGWAPLKRFVKCLDGRRVPLSGEERSLRQGEFPYYGASGIIDHVDDYLFDETLVLLGEDGAQLADADCEISFVVSGRIWVNNHAHVLRPVDSDPSFLALHLSTLDRGSFISGATREKITQDDMNRIPVPNCPLEAQTQAAERVRHVRAGGDVLIECLRRTIDLLFEHRQALITSAVTGELFLSGVA